MKILYLSIVACVGLWAVTAEIKDTAARVDINGFADSYEQGTIFELQENDKICLLSSEGRILITEDSGVQTQLIYPKNLCKTILSKVEKKQPTFLASVKRILFNTAIEREKDGIGSKMLHYDVYREDISDTKEYDYILIKNPTWTTPLELQILDKDKIIKRFKSKNDEFLIPSKFLKSGQRVIVKNSHFGKLYMDSKIK